MKKKLISSLNYFTVLVSLIFSVTFFIAAYQAHATESNKEASNKQGKKTEYKYQIQFFKPL
jgi:hypothetical protein